jgi:hypothetical protein
VLNSFSFSMSGKNEFFSLLSFERYFSLCIELQVDSLAKDTAPPSSHLYHF